MRAWKPTQRRKIVELLPPNDNVQYNILSNYPKNLEEMKWKLFQHHEAKSGCKNNKLQDLTVQAMT